jgi:hypothetical protein
MRSDYAGEMRGHPRTGDEHFDPELLSRRDVFGGLPGSPVGGENAHVAWDIELVQDVAALENHGQIVGTAGENRNHRRIVLVEFAARHLASRTTSF